MKLKSFPRSKKNSFLFNPYHHKVLRYVEYRTVHGVFHILTPHPPLHPASVSSPRTKGGGGDTHSPGGEGGGGSIFWKTSAIGLASYSLISLRLSLSIELVALWQVLPPSGHFTRVNHTGLVSCLAHRLYLHIQQHLPNSSYIERVIFCLVCLASSFSSFTVYMRACMKFWNFM
jgi:hypothetical protein